MNYKKNYQIFNIIKYLIIFYPDTLVYGGRDYLNKKTLVMSETTRRGNIEKS
jgi:hypothetical protein